MRGLLAWGVRYSPVRSAALGSAAPGHAATLLLLSLGACDGAGAQPVDRLVNSDGAPDGGSVHSQDSYPIAEFCADLRAAWVARCKRDGRAACQRDADLGQGDETCSAAQRAATAGRVLYDGERARECLNGGYFDAVRAWQVGWIPPLVCDGMFVGVATLGEACYPEETFQRICEEGYCDRDHACPGTCQPFATTGERCSPARCSPGEYCDGENRCRPELDVGASCPDGGCALPAGCVGGVCRLSADLGETCAADTPCAYPYYCASGRCVTQVSRGEACDIEERCPAQLACAFVPLGGTTRQCALLPGADEPCDRRSGCASGFVCASDGSPFLGTCAPGEPPAPSVTTPPAPPDDAPCTGD
jgi:hypothetical protein